MTLQSLFFWITTPYVTIPLHPHTASFFSPYVTVNAVQYVIKIDMLIPLIPPAHKAFYFVGEISAAQYVYSSVTGLTVIDDTKIVATTKMGYIVIDSVSIGITAGVKAKKSAPQRPSKSLIKRLSSSRSQDTSHASSVCNIIWCLCKNVHHTTSEYWRLVVFYLSYVSKNIKLV